MSAQPTMPSTRRDLAVSRNLVPEPSTAAADRELAFDRFLELAGHDLRSPLAAVHGALESLHRHVGDDLDGLSQELLDVAREATRRVESMLSDMLGYAESLGTGGRRERVELRETVSRAARDVPAVAVEYDRLPAVLGDATGLERLFANLFSNAARHAGDEPTVRIDAWGADGRWRIAVSDDGPGIPVDQRERILEPFVKAGPTGGTGLGLSLVQRIAFEHGSRIEITDGPRGGARFVFSLAAAD